MDSSRKEAAAFHYAYANEDTEENIKSSGFGIAEYPHIHGLKKCPSKKGCKLGDGRIPEQKVEGCCSLCGGKVN